MELWNIGENGNVEILRDGINGDGALEPVP